MNNSVPRGATGQELRVGDTVMLFTSKGAQRRIGVIKKIDAFPEHNQVTGVWIEVKDPPYTKTNRSYLRRFTTWHSATTLSKEQGFPHLQLKPILERGF